VGLNLTVGKNNAEAAFLSIGWPRPVSQKRSRSSAMLVWKPKFPGELTGLLYGTEVLKSGALKPPKCLASRCVFEGRNPRKTFLHFHSLSRSSRNSSYGRSHHRCRLACRSFSLTFET